MGSTYISLNPGPAATEAGYDLIVYSFNVPSVPMNGSADITAEAGLVPEPGTLLLLGAGLASIAGVLRKRRQRDT